MFSDTHETARTQAVQVVDVRFAYRRFGRPSGLPLLLVNYWAANMDDWDPKPTNGFAAEREVILFDNAGVAGSTGETPSMVMAMIRSCVDFLPRGRPDEAGCPGLLARRDDRAATCV